MKQLVAAPAEWRAPDHVNVDQTVSIELNIGSTATQFKSGVDSVLSKHQGAGTVEVGPTVIVRLVATDADVEVAPSDPITASTASDISLQWVWLIRVKRFISRADLDAIVEVPLTGGAIVKYDLVLQIPVYMTAWYIGKSIVLSWSALAVVVGALFTPIKKLWLRSTRQATRSKVAQNRLGWRRPVAGLAVAICLTAAFAFVMDHVQWLGFDLSTVLLIVALVFYARSCVLFGRVVDQRAADRQASRSANAAGRGPQRRAERGAPTVDGVGARGGAPKGRNGRRGRRTA